MNIRRFAPADYPALYRLWHTVFGDDEEFAEHFLKNVIKPSRGFVAEADGAIVAAAYIIDGISVSGRAFPYIYAVSTLPQYRGHGFGEAVSVACAKLIEDTGEIASLHPAERSLFSWYGKMGFVPTFSLREAIIEVSDADVIPLVPISATEYANARRKLLSGQIFADFSDELLQWRLNMWGGGYFAFDGGIVCAQSYGARMIVPEILAANNSYCALSALSRRFACSECLVRSPAIDKFEGYGNTRDFIASRSQNPIVGYWGFAFD